MASWMYSQPLSAAKLRARLQNTWIANRRALGAATGAIPKFDHNRRNSVVSLRVAHRVSSLLVKARASWSTTVGKYRLTYVEQSGCGSIWVTTMKDWLLRSPRRSY